MKFITTLYALFLSAAHGCSQEEEDSRLAAFRADFTNNLDNLKGLAGDSAPMVAQVAPIVTCALLNTYVSGICTDTTSGLDMTNCCATCKVAETPTTMAAQPTTKPATAAPVAQITTEQGATAAPVAQITTEQATTVAQETTTKSATATTKPCTGEDNEYGMNEAIDAILTLAELSNSEHVVVQQLASMKEIRGGNGFSCAEAKLYLGFAGKQCNDKLDDTLSFKLNDYCCETCSKPTGINWRSCPSTGAQTCEERAACNDGYTNFITKIADLMSDLPFTPAQLYCLVEEQLAGLDGSPSLDWKVVADVFVNNGGSACIATAGPYADAVRKLIQQLPAALPASAWNAIGQLMGKACGAIKHHGDTFDTLLQAIPDSAQDYNSMMTAVADIIENYLDGKSGVDAQQVMDYLLNVYDWQDVCNRLEDNVFASGDSESVKQHKIMARVFNAVVAKTTDFTHLFELLKQVVATVFEDGQVLEVLAKVRSNEILGYEDTKQCVKATVTTVQQYCTDNDALFDKKDPPADTTDDTAGDATSTVANNPGGPDDTTDDSTQAPVPEAQVVESDATTIGAAFLATVLGVLAL